MFPGVSLNVSWVNFILGLELNYWIMKTVYKVRHKATGLFYKPGNCNLDEYGKTYNSKHTVLTHAPRSIAIPLFVPLRSRVFKEHEVALRAIHDSRILDSIWRLHATANDFELVEYFQDEEGGNAVQEKRKYDSSNWRMFSVKLAKVEPDNLITRDGRDAKFVRELNQDESLVEVDGLQYRIGELGYARQDKVATANDIFLKKKEKDLFQVELDKILSDALIHSTELTDEFVKNSVKVLKNNLIDTIFNWISSRYFFESAEGCRLVPVEEVKEKLKQELV